MQKLNYWFQILYKEEEYRSQTALLPICLCKLSRLKKHSGFGIQILWIKLEDISFLAINSLISLSIPGIPQTIQAMMIKYIYFDIFYTELWMADFLKKIGLDLDSIDNDEALSA